MRRGHAKHGRAARTRTSADPTRRARAEPARVPREAAYTNRGLTRRVSPRVASARCHLRQAPSGDAGEHRLAVLPRPEEELDVVPPLEREGGARERRQRDVAG